MHFSTFVAALAATATGVLAQAPLEKTDKYFSITAKYFKHSTSRNSRTYVTEPRQLGKFLSQDPKLCAPHVLIDTRDQYDYNSYQGHIKKSHNLPALGSHRRALFFLRKLERCELPKFLSEKALKNTEYVILYGEDNTKRTVDAASAIFNCLSSRLPQLKVVVMRDDYEKFAESSANKHLLESTPGAGMGKIDKAKEAVRGFFGKSTVVPAAKAAKRDLKAQRRAIVAAHRA